MTREAFLEKWEAELIKWKAVCSPDNDLFYTKDEKIKAAAMVLAINALLQDAKGMECK